MGRASHRVGRTGTGGIQLVNDRININASPGADGNHPGQSDHKVVASPGGTFAKIRFQQSSGMRIKQRNTVQASAAGDQLSLFAQDIVCHQNDLTSLQAVSCHRTRFFRFFRAEHSQPPASVPEDRDSLQSFFIGVQIQVLRLFHRKAVRNIDCGTDGRIDMTLPYRLHIDPLMVFQSHRRDKIFRQIGIVRNLEIFHIIFHDLCIHLVIYISAVERFRFSLIIIRIYRLNPSGNAQHRGQSSRRSDRQEL